VLAVGLDSRSNNPTLLVGLEEIGRIAAEFDLFKPSAFAAVVTDLEAPREFLVDDVDVDAVCETGKCCLALEEAVCIVTSSEKGSVSVFCLIPSTLVSLAW